MSAIHGGDYADGSHPDKDRVVSYGHRQRWCQYDGGLLVW